MSVSSHDTNDASSVLILHGNEEDQVDHPNDASMMLEIFNEAKATQLPRVSSSKNFFTLNLFKPAYEKFLRVHIEDTVPGAWKRDLLAHTCVTPDYLAHKINTSWRNETGNYFLRHDGLQKDTGSNVFNILGGLGCASSSNPNGPFNFAYPFELIEGKKWKPMLGMAFNSPLHKQLSRQQQDFNVHGDAIVRRGKGAERAVFFSLPHIEFGAHSGVRVSKEDFSYQKSVRCGGIVTNVSDELMNNGIQIGYTVKSWDKSNSLTGAFTAASTNPKGKARHRICALLSVGLDAPVSAFFPLCIASLVMFKQGNGRYDHELVSTDSTKVIPLPSIAESAFITANPNSTFKDFIAWVMQTHPSFRSELSRIRALFIQDLNKTLNVQRQRMTDNMHMHVNDNMPTLENVASSSGSKHTRGASPMQRPSKRARNDHDGSSSD